MAQLFPRQGQWTESEYLSLPDTNHIVELSDGRLLIPDLPSRPHQYAVGELFANMRDFVRGNRLGHVAMAPLRVRLWPGKFREPDVLFSSTEHEDHRGDEYWGVPDLVVEVLSPRTKSSSGTERTDRGEKFDEYAKAGVREYWMLDLGARTVEVYVLRQDVYHLLGKWSAGESARSEVLAGFTVAVSGVLEPPR